MFNIRKQIRSLYASSILGQISLSGAWVAILSARGFTLAEIGFAETVFHIVSIIFEIPSGVVADVFGRKKTLLLSCILHMAGDAVMVFSNSFALVCVSIALHALSYNFSSGSGDALAYDSLKSVSREEEFEKYVSTQLVIYRACEGLSTLTAGLALILGYRIAYSTGIAISLFQLTVLSRLCEVRLAPQEKREDIWKEIYGCFLQSVLFLRKAKKALLLMFANSLAGALDILLLFFLQAKLPMRGIPKWALGLALLFMQAGGMLGARLILLARGMRFRAVFALSSCIILLGITLEHSPFYAVMALGGFLSSLADDALQVRTNARLQDMFPSEQRATLVSVESFTFSCVMIVLSPLAGLFFSLW